MFSLHREIELVKEEMANERRKSMKPLNLLKTKPGAIVDHLYNLRAERLQLQKAVDELKSEQKRIEDYLINTLTKEELSKLAGKVASVTLTKSEQANVIDWLPFQAYVKKHGAFELYQKRVSIEAVRERWAQGKEIPGLERFIALSLSINKLGGKHEQ
jgi:hypothetical protein